MYKAKHSTGPFGEKQHFEKILRENTFWGVHEEGFTHTGSFQPHLELDASWEEVDTNVSDNHHWAKSFMIKTGHLEY